MSYFFSEKIDFYLKQKNPDGHLWFEKVIHIVLQGEGETKGVWCVVLNRWEESWISQEKGWRGLERELSGGGVKWFSEGSLLGGHGSRRKDD